MKSPDVGLLPLFERLFSWGAKTTANDVDLEKKSPVSESGQYCKTYKARNHNGTRPNTGLS